MTMTMRMMMMKEKKKHFHSRFISFIVIIVWIEVCTTHTHTESSSVLWVDQRSMQVRGGRALIWIDAGYKVSLCNISFYTVCVVSCARIHSSHTMLWPCFLSFLMHSTHTLHIYIYIYKVRNVMIENLKIYERNGDTATVNVRSAKGGLGWT